MDNLTHGLLGAAIGRLWAARPGGSADSRVSPGVAMAAGALLANLPDLDLVTAFLSPTGYLDHHRGITHSLVLLPAWALLSAAALARRPGRERFRDWFSLSALALLSHLLADASGSYGTFLFAPLSDLRVRLDWLFIVDPFVSGALSLAVIGALAFRRFGARIAAGGLAALALYTGAAALRHRQALARWRERLAADGIVAGKIAAVPQAPSLNDWLLLAEDGRHSFAAPLTFGTPWRLEGDGLAARYLNRFRPLAELRVRRFATAAPPAAQSPSTLRNFFAFARFPVVGSEGAGCAGGADAEIRWRDLQYGWDDRFGPFQLVADLDRQGRMYRIALLDNRPGGPRWIPVPPLKFQAPACVA